MPDVRFFCIFLSFVLFSFLTFHVYYLLSLLLHISRFSYCLVFFLVSSFFDPFFLKFDISARFRATDQSDISRLTCYSCIRQH